MQTHNTCATVFLTIDQARRHLMHRRLLDTDQMMNVTLQRTKMCNLVRNAMNQLPSTTSAVEWAAQTIGSCVAVPQEVNAEARNATMKVLGTVLNTFNEEAEPISGTSSDAVVDGLSNLLESPMEDASELVAAAAQARGIVDGVLASMVSGLSPGEPASEVRKAWNCERAYSHYTSVFLLLRYYSRSQLAFASHSHVSVLEVRIMPHPQ